jgi:hypothetical protein
VAIDQWDYLPFRVRVVCQMRSRIACRLFWKAFRMCLRDDKQATRDYVDAMAVFLELNHQEALTHPRSTHLEWKLNAH